MGRLRRCKKCGRVLNPSFEPGMLCQSCGEKVFICDFQEHPRMVIELRIFCKRTGMYKKKNTREQVNITDGLPRIE